MTPDLENVRSLYREMEQNGWNVKSPLKWGFFFYSDKKEGLEKIYAELKPYNYTLERLEKSDDGTWVLQVSKVETLPPEKLHRRNISFVDLAESYDCGYDGWDAGKK